MPEPAPPVSQRFALPLAGESRLINPPIMAELDASKTPEVVVEKEIPPVKPLLLPPLNRSIGTVVVAEDAAVTVMLPVPERFPVMFVMALALFTLQDWLPEITMLLEIVTLRLAVVLRFVKLPASVKSLPPIVTPLVLLVPKVRLPIERLEISRFVG